MNFSFANLKVSIFVLMCLLLAGCNAITTHTNTNSDLSSVPIAGDLAPIQVHGTTSLYVQGYGVYLNDDGLQQISIPAATSKADELPAVIDRLNTFTLEKDPRQLSIKQASINVQGSNMILAGGSGLKNYTLAVNTSIVVSGNDLVLTAKPEKAGASSYLIISDENPVNYMIQNDQDRYNPNLFMISKSKYTILKLVRNNNLEYGRKLYYPMKDVDYPLSDYSPLSAIPSGVNLKLSFPYIGNEPDLQVYQVSLGAASDSKTKSLLDAVASKFAPGVREIAEAKLAGKKIDGFAQLQVNNSGDYLLKTTSAAKQGLLLITPASAHFVERFNLPFTAKITKPGTVDFPTQGFPYQIEIDTQYDLDFASLDVSLKSILGTGAYQIGGTRHGFIYKIQPQRHYKGNLELKTIFGQSLQLPLDLYIEKIDPVVIMREILSNSSLSILPKTGSFQDVLIQYQNIPNFQVVFSPCKLNDKADFSHYQGAGLENYLFTCDKVQYANDVITPRFQYRKTYRTPVKLPGNFPKTRIFKAMIKSITGVVLSSHYFVRSDIGLWTKVADDKLVVRGMLFDTNEAITSGSLKVTTLQGQIVTGLQLQGTKTIISLPKDSNGDIKNESLIVTMTNGAYSGFVLVHPRGNSYQYNEGGNASYMINSYLSPSDVLPSNQNIGFWGEDYPMKVYGYTDRGLYKAGDEVYFAGFARDVRVFDNLNYLSGKRLAIEVSDPQGNSIYSNSGVALDEFGGFKGSFVLPTTMSLGDVFVRYQLIGDDRAAYMQNIKVQEYQKPTFFADISYKITNNILQLVVAPQYYFGQSLRNYDIKVDRSLVGKDICAYCRWRNEDRYYYNYVFNDSISTGGSFTLHTQTEQSLVQPLFAQSIIKQKGYQYTLKANLIIKDNVSDETQFITKYIDFQPEVKLGLSGQPYERLYKDDTKDERKGYGIDGDVAKGNGLMNRLVYEVYFWSYDQQTQQGVDGNSYYVNGNNYHMIGSGNLALTTNFSVDTQFINNPGSYLVRVYALDKNNTIVGEVQKQIEYYAFSQDADGLLGALPNNYTLTVSVPKKTFEEGEKIPVDIAPYQSGAHVIMTVERGGRIIDSFEQTLVGSRLEIPVKKGYAPNVVINVMQLIGARNANGARKEPRFLVGYAQADVSTAMHELHIELKTDKSEYRPGEKVNLTIITKDSKGRLVNARVSMGVLDQALLALYDVIKEPIPYFFNKLGSNVFTYTNMKLLYQSLRAFANNGSKGGGGDGGKAGFSIIRDDLEDVAFRRGGIYATGGKANISFTLPENLTTWVVDVIGISKDTKLGTARTSFKAAKDLIIEANVPAFLTLGDSLKVPVKLIVPAGKLQGSQLIQGSASLENSSGEKIDLGDFTAKPNSKAIIALTVPQSWLASPYVKLATTAHYGEQQDAMVQTIPLRTEGLVIKDSVGVIGNKGDHRFLIPDHLGGAVSLSLSQFPTNIIDPVVHYLVAYPYGCTEQILSSIVPLSLLQDLKNSGKFDTSLMRDNAISLPNGDRAIDDLLGEGIAAVLSRQQTDGSFGRWDKIDTQNSIQKYVLTAYVYGSLQIIKSKAASASQVNQALKAAEGYLRANRTLSKEGFLYYLSQKAQAGTLSADEKKEMNILKPQSFPYGGLLRYTIAVFSENNEDSKQRKQYATIPTNQDQRTQTSLFLNQTTAYALKLQALAKDVTATQDERMDALRSLLAIREKSGLWGRSTQSNVQALRAIGQVSKNRTKQDKVVCSVTMAGQKSKLVVESGSAVVTRALGGNVASISWDCDAVVIVDAWVSYIPKKLENVLGAESHVTQMNYSISKPDAAIGDLIDLNASRTTTLPGEQVAVEIFIPSSLKLFETISSKNNDAELPFTVSDYNCMPTHWETRFDRLFLYYDNLPATTCDITTQVLKAYNGTTTIMPMRLYEMYKGKINGRKVIN